MSITRYAMIAVSVALAYQIVRLPLMERAPAELAVKVAPGSPVVLSRAAESELIANRTDNASFLAREALAHAPFDARALRVLGLSEARTGRLDNADEMLTLAGNWSLRDDPSHAWLIERRLRQGDYQSAFSHADTLLRRREEAWPAVFKLFTTAALSDPNRAIPVIARLLEAKTTWRLYYLNSLFKTTDGLRVAIPLASLLQRTEHPLSDIELTQLYGALLSQNQFGALRMLREQLNRPPASIALSNGEFNDDRSPAPFQWTFVQKSGALAEIITDESGRGDKALWIQYDGYTSAVFARQLVLLKPGRYRLRAEYKIDEGKPAEKLVWRVMCYNATTPALSIPAIPRDTLPSTQWLSVAGEFTVPADCAGQWVSLEGRPADRRNRMVVWFDRVSITPLSANMATVEDDMARSRP